MPAKTKRPKTPNASLEIRNFKSLRHIRIDPTRINVLIGRPNSGKSNFLEAMTLFNVIQDKTRRNIEPSYIRYNSLDNLFYDRNVEEDISIHYRNNRAFLSYYSLANSFLQVINPTEEFIRSKSRYFQSGLTLNQIQEKGTLPPYTEREQNKFASFFSILNKDGQSSQTVSNHSIINEFKGNPVRRYEYKEGGFYDNFFNAYLLPSGDNLYTIVQGNPKVLQWVQSFFEEFQLEFLIDFNSRKFEIQKKQKGIVYKIPFELTPDTFRRMLFHIAAIYSSKNSTLLFEEPESHSFPPYIKALSDRIKEDKSNTYFITTHSPYFFNSMVEDSKKIRDMSFFYVYYQNFETHIRKLTAKELDNLWGSGADVFFNMDTLKK